MRSRPDILEELDIKSVGCCPDYSVPVTPNDQRYKMAKGAQTQLCAIVLVATGLLSLVSSHSLQGQIRKYIFNNNGLGTYSFEYEISDGTFRKEDGGIVTMEGEDVLVVRGEYGYLDPTGREHRVRYVADANGFQPQTDDDDSRFNDRRIL